VLGETFISYKRFRWLWLTAVFLLLSSLVYVLDSPPGGRNGGTTVGYTLGVLSTVAIIWLMAYGLRKRAYSSKLGTVQGWLAAHVWIGIGLLLLVPLHAGFSFGINVHTLAYVAMVVTILSGIWGVANYAALSGKITAHRGGAKDSAIVEQIFALTDKLESLCVGKSEHFLSIFNRYDFTFSPGIRALIRAKDIPVVDHVAAGALIQEVAEPERDDAIALLGMLDQRADLARGLVEQMRLKALLKIWLYVHVPVSVVLCVALAIHILSVFFFW
jgi:hypothetical protein